MVGLPARGKTYISKKLAYYLNWMHIKTKGNECLLDFLCFITYKRLLLYSIVFNLGEYRRKRTGGVDPAEFFHPENQEAAALRA